MVDETPRSSFSGTPTLRNSLTPKSKKGEDINFTSVAIDDSFDSSRQILNKGELSPSEKI